MINNYPDPPEEEVSDEFELFKPIIDAFVAKYPAVEFGPEHIVFGDYNLERHWLEGVIEPIKARIRESTEIYVQAETHHDKQTLELFKAMITICDLLGIE